MACSVELKTNKLLLDSNFDGYKLSLHEVPTKKCTLKTKVDRILLNPSNQYSLLHTKLFGLQNHLVRNEYDDSECVYFVDQDLNINKAYFDLLSDELNEPVVIWKIPKNKERSVGDYNVSIKFISMEKAIVSDGTGLLYVVQTGCGDNDTFSTVLFAEEVIGPNEGFVILDATYSEKNAHPELHILLLSIKQGSINEPFFSVLNWVILTYRDDCWNQTAIKQLKTKSYVQYAVIEKDCGAVYIICDNECKMILNSDNQVISENQNDITEKYTYQWSQTTEDISICVELPVNPNKTLLKIISQPTFVDVKYDNHSLISGSLSQEIDSDLTTWTLENNLLKISLYKNETGIVWPEMIKGDTSGNQILDPSVVEEVHKKLSYLTSETETLAQGGTTFNSQQVEECDFESDKNTVFQRISGITNETTHKANLGTHQILMMSRIDENKVPAFGIRYDVDICFWQPDYTNNDFIISHVGTLPALGYIQASKKNQKFLVCPPGMSYSIICEYSRHLFIYRHKKPITSSELKHRTTGRRVQNIGEQQVLTISNDEILGICAFNDKLFLLCEETLFMLKL